MKKINLLLSLMLPVLVPVLGFGQASSFQQGGSAGIISHGATIQDCCATLLQQIDSTPQTSVTCRATFSRRPE